ncbi:MAG: hypothetical protein JO306_16365, partial [Gemmatimonadetes bacterium]|nr:hypothetical protein [Gemmatimonadota bacterium]
MRRMQYVAAAAAAWALLAGAPAHAQRTARSGQRPIRVGQTVNGTLTETAPKMTDHGRFQVYTFTARKGQRVLATMRSHDFDAYLTLARIVSGITDAMATDDDRGGGTDARIRFEIPEDGTYLLVAQSLSEDGKGAYTLSLESAPQPTTAAAQPIRIGQTVAGQLAETDAVLDDDSYYDSWTVHLNRGQRIVVEMNSDAFDAFVHFGRMENGQFNSLGTDDDSGGGTNARLRATAPDDGDYVIRANSVKAGEVGAYTLRLTERTPGPVTATPHPIEPNTEVTGKLDDDDPTAEDGSFYDMWTYEGHAGERLKITMRSETFDTFVAIGRMENGTFTEIASNDDGPDGTNSLLEVTLPANGTYTIRAKALN